jgi:hypothetical protein
MLSVHVSMLGMDQRRNGMTPNIKAQLEDEHGCTFETQGFSNSGRNFQLDFPIVPLGAKQMLLRISREDYQDERGRPYQNGGRTTQLASYTVTNLFHATPADWKPDDFPAKRDLDIVSVQLASFDPHTIEYSPMMMGPGFEQRYGFPGMVRPTRPLQNKVTFSQQGKPATGWRKFSANSSIAGETKATTSPHSAKRRKSSNTWSKSPVIPSKELLPAMKRSKCPSQKSPAPVKAQIST